jgi:hypothetical protein
LLSGIPELPPNQLADILGNLTAADATGTVCRITDQRSYRTNDSRISLRIPFHNK